LKPANPIISISERRVRGKWDKDLLNQTYAGGSGQQMRPQSLLSAGFSGVAFYNLDPLAGAAEIERLKAPQGLNALNPGSPYP
jgi:hypothetical protein